MSLQAPNIYVVNRGFRIDKRKYDLQFLCAIQRESIYSNEIQVKPYCRGCLSSKIRYDIFLWGHNSLVKAETSLYR